MAGQGDFPLRSAWLGRGRGRGRGRGAWPRSIVNTAANTANNAYKDLWADWFFESAGAAAQEIQPSLVTNNQTFPAPTVAATYALTAGLHTNNQTFPAATVSAGAVPLTPTLLTNNQTFYGPTVSQPAQDLTPSLFTNSQTFYAPIASASDDIVLVGVTPRRRTSRPVYGQPLKFDKFGFIVRSEAFGDEADEPQKEIAETPVVLALSPLAARARAREAEISAQEALSRVLEARTAKENADRLDRLRDEFNAAQRMLIAARDAEAWWQARLREDDEIILLAA